MKSRDELNRASEHLDRAGDHTAEAAAHAKDAAHHAKEAMEAGAAGTLERTREVAREAGRTAERAGRQAGHVAERVSHAPPNRELEQRVDSTTERAADKTGQALHSAAPVVGKGVAATVGAAGSALHALEAPVGAVVGKIAAKVGGWWNSARQAIRELPKQDRERYRAHFDTYPNRPAGLTFDTALTAYALGHVAAENPAYQERDFAKIEPDIRHGFDEVEEQEYKALSDFAKFSYEHVMTIRPSQDGDRVKFH